MRIFITGGTGFIGSFLATELLKKGAYLVFLARSTKQMTTRERVDRVLSFVNPDVRSLSNSYDVIEGDVTLKDLGLAGSERRIGHIDRVFHVAASTDFEEKYRDKTSLTNQAGTKNVLDFCSARGIKDFHHISTLYVAGLREGVIHEDELDCGQEFSNIYEESKMEGEKLVHHWAKEAPDNTYRIYRLPVVCGESHAGKTTIFSGLYGFLAPFWVLKTSLQRKFERDGHSLRSAGIRECENSDIHIPLIIRFSSSSPVELLPVDWVIDQTIRLAENASSENMTFHLCHESPPLGRRVTEQCLRFMGIEGICILDDWPEGKKPEMRGVLRSLQKNVDLLINRFTDYKKSCRVFDNRHVQEVLGDSYAPPPQIDDNLLKTITLFAMEHNFRSPSFEDNGDNTMQPGGKFRSAAPSLDSTKLVSDRTGKEENGHEK